jgi:hypothetical protein
MSPLALAVDVRTGARARGLRRVLLVLPALLVGCGFESADPPKPCLEIAHTLAKEGAYLECKADGQLITVVEVAGQPIAICGCPTSLAELLDAGAP